MVEGRRPLGYDGESADAYDCKAGEILNRKLGNLKLTPTFSFHNLGDRREPARVVSFNPTRATFFGTNLLMQPVTHGRVAMQTGRSRRARDRAYLEVISPR